MKASIKLGLLQIHVKYSLYQNFSQNIKPLKKGTLQRGVVQSFPEEEAHNLRLALSVFIKLLLRTKKSVFAKGKVSRAKYFNSDLTQTPGFKLDHNILCEILKSLIRNSAFCFLLLTIINPHVFVRTIF